MKEAGNRGATVYPSPTAGLQNISLHYDHEDIAQWRVVDLTGRVVLMSKQCSGHSEQVQDMTALNPGIYVLQLEVNDAPEKVWRIALTDTEGQ